MAKCKTLSECTGGWKCQDFGGCQKATSADGETEKRPGSACPACNGVPEVPDDPQCLGQDCCDYTGTLEGYQAMQKIESEVAEYYASQSPNK